MKLTQKQKKAYLKIEKTGNMAEMFAFAYLIGRASVAEEILKRYSNKNRAKRIK